MKILSVFCIFSFFYSLVSCQDDSPITIERMVEASGLTEGPHWDHHSQKLFFVDIWSNKLCSYNPENSKVSCAYIANGPVGVAVPVEDSPDTFVVGAGADIVLVTWDGENNSTNPQIRKLNAASEIFSTGTRFNDGKVDSSGRLWAGTLTEINGKAQPNQGVLYSLDENLVLKTQIQPVTISNGLAWNIDDDTFYYIDSPTRQIAAYNYNPYNGSIDNRRIVFDLGKNNLTGVPDGMTIDIDGNLWVALFGGAQLIHVNPSSGKILRAIPMPAQRVTSVAFGGPELEILYVTTAGYGFANSQEKTPANDLQGGSIFAIKGTGSRGFLSNVFKLNK